MKGIILYSSKYGATKRYAEWLADDTGFDCVETKNAKIGDVCTYDTIILGGGLFASRVAGISFLKKNIDKLSGKKIIVFCDGVSPYDEHYISQLVELNMKGLPEGIPLVYCRGIWNPKDLRFLDSKLCGMLRKALKKKDPSEYEVWEKALVETGDELIDWTDKSYLKPILEMIGE